LIFRAISSRKNVVLEGESSKTLIFYENVCFRVGFWKNAVFHQKSLILIKIPDAQSRNSRKSHYLSRKNAVLEGGNLQKR